MRTEPGRILLLFVIGSLWYSDLQGQDADRWTPEDIIKTEYVQQLRFSPRGDAVVWTKRRPVDEKDRFVNDIYMTRLDRKKEGLFATVRMTYTDESDNSPLFSPDSESIYFLSTREEGKKLWKMSVFGGEAMEVHEFKNGISNIRWRDDKTLVFISNDGKTLYEEENKKDNTIVVEDSVHWKISRLYSFDVESKEIERLTNNSYPISRYEVSHRGRYLVARLTMSTHYGADGSPDPEVYLYDLETRNSTQILQGLQQPTNFQFDGDDKGIYFSATTSSDPEWEGSGISELYYHEISSDRTMKVDMDWANGLSQGFTVTDNNLIASLANGPTRRLAYYQRQGYAWVKKALDFGTKNDHVSLLGISKDGNQIAYVHSTASQMPKYYISNLGSRRGVLSLSGEQELARVNDKLLKKPIATSEIYYWEGANGDRISGILYYPERYEAGKKYPLILSIHGGPTGVDTDSWSERWSTYPQIYSQKGAFVLKPNYHGSGNHSLEFIESIKKGVYYDLEEVDILNGIKALETEGKVDTDSLGIMGWSNGAILTTMMTLRHPELFKAAAPGAGDVNWTSDYGTCRFGVTFDQSYFQGAPWDDVDGKSYNEMYILKSPLFEIEKIRTPTIIFHGSEDRAVPRDQGWEYYRGLQQVGKAPVRFLWFPGQPHGLQKITHQLRKMKEEIAWFDTYLFGTVEPKNVAFKKVSPLARKLKMNDWSIQNGVYGEMTDNILIPEMVSLGKDTISISRFEVTNAQYRAHLASHEFPAGEENYPVRKLSQEQISAYLDWLNRVTSRKYRLPNSNEGKALHRKGYKIAAKDNTLNYWAGYEITEKEVSALRLKLAELEYSLIKEVGEYEAIKIGEGELYDIGGNVAEYYLEGSRLKTYGYSAYDFVDPFSTDSSPSEENTGFRLVADATTGM